MKQFDLQAALNGAPVVTRNGEKVSQLFHATALGMEENLLVIINGRGYFYYESGRYSNHGESPLDLIMAPTKRVFYQNIYRSFTGAYCGSGALFMSEAEAHAYDRDGRVAAVKIEFED